MAIDSYVSYLLSYRISLSRSFIRCASLPSRQRCFLISVIPYPNGVPHHSHHLLLFI